MSLEGMDVDQAQRLAQRLDGYARALAQITIMLTTLTAELSQHWRGPASATFQQRWTAQYHGALSGAAHALADMHTHLVANIQQQIQTSAADPNGGQIGGIGAGPAVAGFTLAGLLGGASLLWQDVNLEDKWLSIGASPVEHFQDIVGHKQQLPGLKWLPDNPHAQQAYKAFEDAHGAVILKRLDEAGTGINVVNGFIDVGKAVDNVGHGHYTSAGGNLVDATSEGLKAGGTKYPILYPLGVELAMLHKSYDQVQWDQGVPNPLDPGVFQNDYVPSFKAIPGEFVSTFWESL